jgi:hypothetical protein
MNYFYSLQNVVLQYSIVSYVSFPVEHFMFNFEVFPISIKSSYVLPIS